ncbi:MAG: HmuY protein [Mucilaginibacter sp.]|nr:HmuY protein [Mucilaginibacter sp.]
MKTLYNKLKPFFIMMLAILLASSCTKDQVTPQLQDGKSTVVNDLPGDVGKTISSGFKTFYFSFTTNAKVDSSQKKTSLWDISFSREYNSYVTINNGTNEASLGFGGTGKGSMVVVNKAYDQVTEAPSDDVFTATAITTAGWDSGSGNGWYFYDLKTHLAIPVKNRTYVLRTADGKYAKLEMISMYKGAPSVVTDLNWPAPYFTFRYYVQQDGGRNLSTKD